MHYSRVQKQRLRRAPECLPEQMPKVIHAVAAGGGKRGNADFMKEIFFDKIFGVIQIVVRPDIGIGASPEQQNDFLNTKGDELVAVYAPGRGFAQYLVQSRFDICIVNAAKGNGSIGMIAEKYNLCFGIVRFVVRCIWRYDGNIPGGKRVEGSADFGCSGAGAVIDDFIALVCVLDNMFVFCL